MTCQSGSLTLVGETELPMTAKVQVMSCDVLMNDQRRASVIFDLVSTPSVRLVPDTAKALG